MIGRMLPVEAITNSVESTLPEILANETPLLNEDEPPPTSAQIVAAQEEITELMEALKDIKLRTSS